MCGTGRGWGGGRGWVGEQGASADFGGAQAASHGHLDRVGTLAANTTPHGAGALKTGISGSTRRIVRGVREHCLGRILCTCDVQVRRHRRLRRRQAVHTSLHVGVALKSGLVVGIVQLLDDVQRVVSSSTSARLARTTRSARRRISRSIRPPTAVRRERRPPCSTRSDHERLRRSNCVDRRPRARP